MFRPPASGSRRGDFRTCSLRCSALRASLASLPSERCRSRADEANRFSAFGERPLHYHPAESCRGATISRFGGGYAAPWDMTRVFGAWQE